MKKIPGPVQPAEQKEPTEEPAPGRCSRLRKMFDPSRSGGILFLLLFLGMYAAIRLAAPSGSHHAQLQFVDGGRPENSATEAASQVSYREPFSGSAYETALRLRELGALGMAISLSVFPKHTSSGSMPATGEDVIRELSARNLLPPGIDVESGSLRSEMSDLRFDYRPEPLSFELMALPKEQTSGPSLLLRFPLPPSGSNSVMYFESASPAQIAAPFSTSENLTARGWKIRHWRGDALPLNDSVVGDLHEQDTWLQSVSKSQQ